MRREQRAGEQAERARDGEREIGAPGDELAMREIGEAQDRIGQRDADGAEPDHRAGNQPVEQDLRGHGGHRRAACARAEIEFGDDRIVGERGGGALVADLRPRPG